MYEAEFVFIKIDIIFLCFRIRCCFHIWKKQICRRYSQQVLVQKWQACTYILWRWTYRYCYRSVLEMECMMKGYIFVQLGKLWFFFKSWSNISNEIVERREDFCVGTVECFWSKIEVTEGFQQDMPKTSHEGICSNWMYLTAFKVSMTLFSLNVSCESDSV